MEAVLTQPVLVLNRLWQAVNTCSARRAFSLLYLGHAQVVHAEDESFETFNFEKWFDHSQSIHHDHGDWVKTVHFRIKVPKIIVLLGFDHLPMKEVKLTRQNIFERDNYTCQYCHQAFDRHLLNIDHIMPRDRGGRTTWENVATSCIRCNTKKGNRLPHEANMQLLKKAKKPKLRPFINVHITRERHPSWSHFLDFGKWKVDLSS
jgi:5-methylcytosine-specific restriction endonuclease McrA